MKAETINVRLSADFILTKEQAERLVSKYISLKDKDDKIIGEGELYLIGYEDEDRRECDEDGNYLEE